jgi:hypothetical protein
LLNFAPYYRLLENLFGGREAVPTVGNTKSKHKDWCKPRNEENEEFERSPVLWTILVFFVSSWFKKLGFSLGERPGQEQSRHDKELRARYQRRSAQEFQIAENPGLKTVK